MITEQNIGNALGHLDICYDDVEGKVQPNPSLVLRFIEGDQSEEVLKEIDKLPKDKKDLLKMDILLKAAEDFLNNDIKLKKEIREKNQKLIEKFKKMGFNEDDIMVMAPGLLEKASEPIDPIELLMSKSK